MGWNETVNELEQSTGEKKGMILRMYDVKNMFAALPRKQILKAVDELFEMTKGRRWGRNNDKRLLVVPKLKADRNRLTRIGNVKSYSRS